MKNNGFAFVGLVAFFLLSACQKDDNNVIPIAGTRWCATLSDEKSDYKYQVEFLKNKRAKTLMHEKVRANAALPGLPVETFGAAEFDYQMIEQPIDATDVRILLSDTETGFRDTLIYYRATKNDGAAKIVGKHYTVTVRIGDQTIPNNTPLYESATITYYAGGCAF